MKLSLLLTLNMLLQCYSSFSQEYSYTRYDVKDGLAGSNVYCITQDKLGFLWMGTEAGLSRFDGVHFKNFSLKDGLPDIEVLQIFADSKGRVWMGPFSRSICYYYEGKIHNKDNDTLLKKIHIRSGIQNFAEDREGNILIQEFSALHLVSADGTVRDIDSIRGKPVFSSCIGKGPDGHFLVQDRTEIYRFEGKDFTHLSTIAYTANNSNFIAINPGVIAWNYAIHNNFILLGQNRTVTFLAREKAMQHVSLSLSGDSLAYRNGTFGVSEYNLFKGTVREFQVGAKISRTFRDDEGNLWFTSLGQGIFRLNSEDIRNITLRGRNSAPCIPLTIRRIDNELLVGTTHTAVFRLPLPSLAPVVRYEPEANEANEVYYVGKTKHGRLLIGTSQYLLNDSIPRNTYKGYFFFSVRTAFLRNDSELVAGGRHGVCVFNTWTLRIKDTLWRERATVLYPHYNTTYIGTIYGLYVMEKGGPPVYWGDRDTLLQKRISSVVQSDDSTLWVATYGGGIVGWKDGRRVVALTSSRGLSSDLCRALALHDHTLWVGTDKGLNKVDLSDAAYPVTTYRASDGLSSDIINVVCADSTMVYVGTPGGLSFFDVRHIGGTSGCRLTLLSLISSGRNRLADTAGLSLPYDRNNIRFEYAGISYRSGGDISYRYRLLGLDSSWKTTNESFLDYPTLPSGDYELQLQAVNKFGITSRMLSQHFSVATPFWRTVWFDVAILALLVFLSWLIVTLRIKQIRRRQAEQEELHKRMAETEHMALQAQMNPHFIFNCLNSIQQYIFDQDIQVANKYLTGFAKLIRATLYNSSKPFVTLAEEIAYISAYLSLEKLRFKEKMDYAVEVEPSLRGELEDIHLPPMLIQPYVENSMRHGLRHRTKAGGYIRINVLQEGDKLTFIIEDNGIGREQAARYKTREHIEYQSRGMSLTADRIRLINSVNGGHIAVEVFDLKDQQGVACGTRVVVRFPRYDTLVQKNGI